MGELPLGNVLLEVPQAEAAGGQRVRMSDVKALGLEAGVHGEQHLRVGEKMQVVIWVLGAGDEQVGLVRVVNVDLDVVGHAGGDVHLVLARLLQGVLEVGAAGDELHAVAQIGVGFGGRGFQESRLVELFGGLLSWLLAHGFEI